jgi:MFS transporter, PAT family, beta-lactamase induction signal transducer AmpG
VLIAVAAGYVFTQRALAPLAAAALGPLLEGSALKTRWIDLATLLLGIGVTGPLAAWAARRARFETLLNGLAQYFAQPGSWAFLGFIVLYKLGDAFAGSLMTPFLLKAMAYAPAEVGVVNKILGLWLTIGGALLGGVLMLRLGLWRALLLFGVLQMASNLGFWWLAVGGKGALPGLVIPAFDWGFLQLAQPTPVDGSLLAVIAGENLPDEPDAPALHGHAVRDAERLRRGRPGLGRAAGRGAGRGDRLAELLRAVHAGGAAGVVDALGAARHGARARGRARRRAGRRLIRRPVC